MQLTINEILKATSGRLSAGNKDAIIHGVSTDTRTIKAGDLYFALTGARFDGHNFVAEAEKKKAVGAVVCEGRTTSPGQNLPSPSFLLVNVTDTLRALGDLANFWRKKFSIPVVGVTGSSGKTTTKDLIAACLEKKGSVLKNERNLNNLIGLPLSALKLQDAHRFCVLEMGMNAFGEIARLTEISEPTIGVIANVGRAHLEGVGDIEGVAKAKGELFEKLTSNAVAVVNADDPFIARMTTRARKRTFGYKKKADINCLKVICEGERMRVTIGDPDQKTEFLLPFVGEYHVMNWLACYAVCYQLGVTPDEAQEALNTFQLSEMRGQEIPLSRKMVLINDAYNANPDSMEASFKALTLHYPKRRKIAVLGEMLELGTQTTQLHREVGCEAARQGMEVVLTYGDHAEEVVDGFVSEKKSAFSFKDFETLNEKLKELLKDEDVILVKGSRGTQMEKVVKFLKDNFLEK